MRRGWSLVETLVVAILSTGFFLFAGAISVQVRGHYRALAIYADDLNRATRQFDSMTRDVRAARQVLDTTPDGSLAGPGVLVLQRPGDALVVYRLNAGRLQRLSGSPLVAEDLGLAGSLSVVRQSPHDVDVTLGLVARGGGAPALLSTAARCNAGRIK